MGHVSNIVLYVIVAFTVAVIVYADRPAPVIEDPKLVHALHKVDACYFAVSAGNDECLRIDDDKGAL